MARNFETNPIIRRPFSLIQKGRTATIALTAHQCFVTQQSLRLEGILDRLSSTHRHIIRALPYLFHANSPSLPGWCADAVEGIDQYVPTKSQKLSVKALAPAYRFRSLPSRTAIEAIYVMGSAGSLAQTRTSDIDIWVCLAEALHPRLRDKVARIEQWALEFDLELQIFLVDPKHFGSANIASTSYSPILLDEFYRSSCHIAGRYPLWWLVPTDCNQKAAYAAHIDSLIDRRIIDPKAFHDFGPVRDIPPGALIAATIREFQSSLKTPYKSLLKLALLESYFHNAPLLSDSYKKGVLTATNGRDSDIQDVYLLLHQHLEKYSPEGRREFLRYAWLTKSIRGNSRLSKSSKWRELADAWGFTTEDIDRMRWPNTWHVRQWLDEQKTFAEAYSFLCVFLKDLLQTGSKSIPTALLEECLETLKTAARIALGEGTLHPQPAPGYASHATIIPSANGWLLQDGGQPAFQGKTRTEVLCWLKTKGFPRAALTQETWIKRLWPLLGTNNLLIVNAEPEPAHRVAATDSLRDSIWSLDAVDRNGTHRVVTLREAVDYVIEHDAQIICLNPLATGLFKKLHHLTSVARAHSSH